MKTASSYKHGSSSSLRQTLAHSSLETIPHSPHTPLRQTTPSSQIAFSPSSRTDEDCIIFEFGNRYLRAGYANDHAPRCTIGFGPDEQRRAGDYSQWESGLLSSSRGKRHISSSGEAHELWNMDLRGVDLGLIEDKIERAVREAYNKYLLTDTKSRRLLLALPSGLPNVLLSSVLTTLFSNLQCPLIGMISSPVLIALAAGLRSALVIDIGWSETTVTSLLEYRELNCSRSVRAMKGVVHETGRLLARRVCGNTLGHTDSETLNHHEEETDVIRFEELEDIVLRTAWCRSMNRSSDSIPANTSQSLTQERSHGLKGTIQQVRDAAIGSSATDGNSKCGDPSTAVMNIHLQSTMPPMTLSIPFLTLSEPTENALFRRGRDHPDDHEVPVDLLAYRALQQIPIDARSICMARIIITGGGSNIPGIKRRIIQEIRKCVEESGWDPVRGRASDQRKEKQRKLAEARSKQSPPMKQTLSEGNECAAFTPQEADEVAEKILCDETRSSNPPVREDYKGQVRGVESLGTFAGASIAASLKMKCCFEVERERFLSHGVTGLSREEMETSSGSNSRLSVAASSSLRTTGDRTSRGIGALS